MVNDPISDFIVRIKNASAVHMREVVMPYSLLKHSIANVLKQKGFIESVTKKGKGIEKVLCVQLLERDRNTRGIHAYRISRPSRRVYVKASEIKPVRNGSGLVVLSTPKGVLSGDDARNQNVGGEILCKLW
jgi:small subunit ribosomal protein S8